MPYGDVDSQMLVWKVVPLMTAVIVYVVLLVSTVGVPLMVHVLLSIFKPVGRLGEATQLVAPVTSVMPPPEPLLAVVEESQVLLPETATGELWSVLLPPSPNCPILFIPQHFRSPLSRMAQVLNVSADIVTAVRPVPRSIAVNEGALVCELLLPPSPNCP